MSVALGRKSERLLRWSRSGTDDGVLLLVSCWRRRMGVGFLRAVRWKRNSHQGLAVSADYG